MIRIKSNIDKIKLRNKWENRSNKNNLGMTIKMANANKCKMNQMPTTIANMNNSNKYNLLITMKMTSLNKHKISQMPTPMTNLNKSNKTS